jgi:hypothetical protein
MRNLIWAQCYEWFWKYFRQKIGEKLAKIGEKLAKIGEKLAVLTKITDICAEKMIIIISYHVFS